MSEEELAKLRKELDGIKVSTAFQIKCCQFRHGAARMGQLGCREPAHAGV